VFLQQPCAVHSDYRNIIQRTFGAKYTPDDAYAGDLFSALGAIESGVTCIRDWPGFACAQPGLR
jgi:cytosine/adenosine deaminase-related metal-dependent hydrolase